MNIMKKEDTALVKEAIDSLKDSLCASIDRGSLYSRSHIAHKWKAPWRCLLLRESVAWRSQDLLEQSNLLQVNGNLLGARILLRSAFETVAMLIFLNQAMRSVVADKADFHDFSEKTTKLLLGSRDKSTNYDSINILTILAKADLRYPGIQDLYAALSESAHPNYEGLLFGYAKEDHENSITSFANNWDEMHGSSHSEILMTCLGTFIHEYDEEFNDAFEALERWIAANDKSLENTRKDT